jgi:hypothetical protein
MPGFFCLPDNYFINIFTKKEIVVTSILFKQCAFEFGI